MNTFEEASPLPSLLLTNLSNRNETVHAELVNRHFLLIIFETVRICTSICSVLGVLGNISLIYIIGNTSFRHVSYGLLIIVIAFFDSIRLISGIFYYLLFANIIPLNITTLRIYIAMDRYPIFVVNWCKLLMSIERLLTVRYWEHHTHLDWRSKHKRKQLRQFLYSIFMVLLLGLISQHPNYLFYRYESVRINYDCLMLSIKQNSNYFYTYLKFHGSIFTIISYLILDTTMPICLVLVVNILLLREIRKLPLPLQVKVKESIGILLFLTALSIAILPRAFIAFYGYYSRYDNEPFIQNLFVLFYICLGLEYINHAITGYACFLSSALLRSELKNMIWNKYILPHLH